MRQFENRNILIVGGSSGIGLSTARLLAEEGARLYLWSRREMDTAEIPDAIHARIDVTRDLAEQSYALPERLDGLVYAPGTISLGAFQRLKPETYVEDYTVNVVGAVRVIAAAHDALIHSGASVVLFGTVAARIGMQFHASIASAKAALGGLAISLAAEYASKRVRFNVVAPSLTDTPLAARLLSNDKKRHASAERHPLGRVGTPEDSARAAVFLLDGRNDWITGQVLGVDGGLGSISGL